MGGGIRYWSWEDNKLIRYIWGDIGLDFSGWISRVVSFHPGREPSRAVPNGTQYWFRWGISKDGPQRVPPFAAPVGGGIVWIGQLLMEWPIKYHYDKLFTKK